MIEILIALTAQAKLTVDTTANVAHMIQVDTEVLQQQLLGARARTLSLTSDLTGSQLLGPRLKIVNPPLWEIGHLAWFQERWCLRHREGEPDLRPSLRHDADDLYDSSSVPHETRWGLPLPSLERTLEYLDQVLQQVLDKLAALPADALLYFAQLAALHEEMHCEAFTYTRQTLGYSAPRSSEAISVRNKHDMPQGDANIAGGSFMLGARPDDGFVFDNEKWAHPVMVAPFSIARACVTNDEFLSFVEDAGYSRRELWSGDGWVWRAAVNASRPAYWRKIGNEWCARVYDEWLPIVADAALIHVNWYEADAYCRWAHRRLPSEAEWEYAASSEPGDVSATRRYPWGDQKPNELHANLYGSSEHSIDVAAYEQGDSAWGCRQMIGNVWEWTADTFAPYPGYVVDPYKEYSQPWFGDHRVLRGGCFATRGHLIRNTWRNFYTPDRRDVFSGFRTCA
jgi:iron(II)-dependent oxidoreductase